MSILSQVLLLAGIAAISTSAALPTRARFPTFDGKYIIVLREFQNYTGGPLPSTYNNSKATVEKFLRGNSSAFTRERFYNLWERYDKLFFRDRHDIPNYLNRYYPLVGQYSPLYVGFVAELNTAALAQVSNLLLFSFGLMVCNACPMPLT